MTAAEAHIALEAKLRAAVANTVGAVWDNLGSYNQEDVDRWLTLVVPLVLAAQRQSVSLTDGYLGNVLGRGPLGVNPDELVGAGVRNGTTPQDAYRRPFVTVWSALKAGALYDDAVKAGRGRAVGMAATDVQLSMRATMNAVQAQDRSIRGFKRVADPGACKFCQRIDGAFVRSADAMALHNHCGCGLEPVTDGRVNDTPVPDDVAVHSHGELGPVLSDPAHKFTTEVAI